MSALFMEEEMPKKHRRGMKRYLMIGVIGLALAWAAPAMATNIVTFDPTGTAGPGGISPSTDWTKLREMPLRLEPRRPAQ